MTNLPEASDWVAGIYQIEMTDPVLGGPPNLETGAGIANVQAQQLAERTAWLKEQIAAAVAFVITTGTGLSGGGAIGTGLTLTADLADQAVAEAGSNNLQLMTALRTRQAIDVAINALVGAAPTQLDTLNELAAAITDNGDTSAALTALIASKLDAGIYTPQDILAKLLGVDGTGSGLDADTLDGKHASEFTLAGSGNLPTAWVNFNGQGTVAIREAFNVSSITDLGGGHYRVNFASPMASTNYAILGLHGNVATAGDERNNLYIDGKTTTYANSTPQMFTAKLAIGTTYPS